MSKSFYTLVFSSLLLFQTAIYAEEGADTHEETIIEDVLPMDEVAEETHETEDTPEQEVEQNESDIGEAQEEISEAQREADAAEAAELQEVGTGEEPVAE